jgi:hypothetical protein
MILSAYLGVVGLSDIGYQFFYADETPCGARITTGIVDAGGGWYSVNNPVIPDTAGSVRWNSAGTPAAVAREYFTPVAVNATVIAEEILKHDWTLVSGEADESVLNALRSMRNKWAIDVDGTLTVYKEDGSTVAWTRSIASDRTAAPVIGMS